MVDDSEQLNITNVIIRDKDLLLNELHTAVLVFKGKLLLLLKQGK
jgi:hypothetical protein